MNEHTEREPAAGLADVDLQVAEKNAQPPAPTPPDKEREADQIAAEARDGALAKSIGTEPA